MKRSSKKKKILIVLALLMIAGLPVSYYAAREVLKYRIKGWRADGIAASQAGANEKASELLVRYLQRRPEDIEALSHYITSREKAELPNGQHLAETIGALKAQRSLTVLMAEQNFAQALRIADRGYVIVHGRIAFAGNSAAELNDNALIRKFYMGL